MGAITSIFSMLKQAGADVAQLCYPSFCAACKAEAPAGAYFCQRCEGELKLLTKAPACDRCAMPVAALGLPCPWCEGTGLKPYKHVARLGAFVDPLKGLIHQVKYHRRWSTAEHLTDRLYAKPIVKQILDETDVLLPVPLFALRHVKRGFNQADVVACRLATLAGKKVVRPVVRWRATETQTRQHGRVKRLRNLRGAFVLVEPELVSGKRVTVVDDVLTTGATLRTIARTMRDAKPVHLCAITIAIADPEWNDFEKI